MKTQYVQVAIFSLLYLQEAFEDSFGSRAGIPQPNKTRWNSTFTHINSVLKCKQQPINDMLASTNHTHLKFTTREWSQLEELKLILDPFLEATTKTQGDKVNVLWSSFPLLLCYDLLARAPMLQFYINSLISL